MTNRIVIILLSSLLLCACDHATIYTHYQAVPINGWHQDSVLTFDFMVPDTTADYQVLINIRHTETYPYQNMWLFTNQDTIEFYLADDRGAWLGNGGNGYIEMPVLYEEAYHYSDTLQHISIRHGMRDSLLRGISDVGITVKKITK